MKNSIKLTVLRGIQANQEYYSTMLSLKQCLQLLPLETEDLPPELRKQRTLSKSRSKKISDYLINNPKSYVLSSLVVALDTDHLEFTPNPKNPFVGTLTFPKETKCCILDGQHRRKAFESALKTNPSLRDETINVLLYLDTGLTHSQQIFSDLNRYTKSPPKNLNILYDDRDSIARLTKEIRSFPLFKALTECEKSSLTKKSEKLFVLQHLYDSIKLSTTCLKQKNKPSVIKTYWQILTELISDWQKVKQQHKTASEIRNESISHTALALNALGKLGAQVCYALQNNPQEIKSRIHPLETFNWKRNNPKFQEIGCIDQGKLIKNTTSVTALTALLKQHLELPLDTNEKTLLLS